MAEDNLAEDACPGAFWQKLPFLPNPPTPTFNPTQWTATQVKDYAKGTLLSGTAVNVAFLAVVVALFVFQLLWRLAGCLSYCCRACCGIQPRLRARKSLLSFEVMHDPWLKAHKVAFCFFAAGCIALAATGLATLPRPEHLVTDLAVRLESASAFASSLLSASDGLIGAANNVRPVVTEMARVLQEQLGASQTVDADMQCASHLLDEGLAGPANPAVLGPQLDAASAVIRNGLEPAMQAASALLNATHGTNGTMTALAAVAVMPSELAAMQAALSAYSAALGGLPSSRLPLSASSPAVSNLQASQGLLNISGWISNLDTVYGDLITVTAAAPHSPFSRLAAALRSQQGAAANVTQKLSAISAAAASLDALYLGTPVELQSQPDGATGKGRACLGRLATQIARLEADLFRFNSTAERTAIDTLYAVRTSLEKLYGIGANSSAANATARPTPLASLALQLGQMLGPIALIDVSGAAADCDAAQAALSYPNGSSSLPDPVPTLSYIQQLRQALADLQAPAAGVAASLASYGIAPSDDSYSALYAAASNARVPYASTAWNASSAPLPSGGSVLAAAAANATAAAGSARFASTMPILVGNMSVLGEVLASGSGVAPGSSSWTAVLDRTATSLTSIQAILANVTQRQQSGGNGTAVNAAGGGSNNNTSSPSSSSSPPPSGAAALSAFLEPLKDSVALVASTLSNGIAAVSEQLDNALGKALFAASPSLVSSTSGTRHLLNQASSSSTAVSSITTTTTTTATVIAGTDTTHSGSHARALRSTFTANATDVVRQQLVKRLDDVASMLRRDATVRYSRLGYWVPVAVYSAVIAITLLLGAAVFCNFPAGLVVCLLLHLFLAGLVLLGAWAAAAGTVVTHDSCGNADSIVLGAVSPSSPLFPLVRYYLQGVGGTLSTVLRSTGLGDTARLQAACDIVSQQILDPLLLPAPPSAATPSVTPNSTTVIVNSTASVLNSTTGATIPWPGSLGSVQYVLGGVLVDVGAIAANVSANLGTLLRLGDRSAVLAQYTSVTSWGCCGLGSKLLVIWVCATGCGLLAWLAALSAVMVLKNLDDMPVGRCCGCSCYNPKNFPRPERRRLRGGDAGGSCGRVLSSGGGSSNTSGGGASSGGGLLHGGPPAKHPHMYATRCGRDGMPYYYVSTGGSSTVSSGGGYSSACTSSGGAPPYGAAAAAGSYVPPNGIHWPTGKRRSTSGGGGAKPIQQPHGKETVVESGLFQGPPPPPPPPSGPSAAGPGGLPAAGGAAGAGRSSVSVCVMDPDTATAFGFGGSDGDAGLHATGQSFATPPNPPAAGLSALPLPPRVGQTPQ